MHIAVYGHKCPFTYFSIIMVLYANQVFEV